MLRSSGHLLGTRPSGEALERYATHQKFRAKTYSAQLLKVPEGWRCSARLPIGDRFSAYLDDVCELRLRSMNAAQLPYGCG